MNEIVAAEKSTEPEVQSDVAVPSHDVLIYDGHCKFCTRQVERLKWFDRRKSIEFVSLHDASVRERFPDLSYDQLMEAMYLVDTSGRRYRAAEVLRYLSRKLPLLWPVCPILYIPFSLPLWNWMYGKIASVRYRWGKTTCDENGTCEIHFGAKK